MTAGKQVRINARVPLDLAEQFRRVASEDERSLSQELRVAMKRHVSTAGAKA